ncbi:hypothetical protein ACQ86N_14065 [Puia sp. P3]|uniref:hypothetical protein n=1 Tax=Puia sp. P3 TaxID=3423952 RepID=UPI003D67AC22
MRGFFKSFFAALLALIIFTVIAVIILVGVVGGLLSPSKPDIDGKAVLMVDLGQTYKEQTQDNPFPIWDPTSSTTYPVFTISSG